MSLFTLIVVLLLGVASIAALIYSWLIAGQRNHTYGTIVVPRKAGKKGESRIAKTLKRFKTMIRKLTHPIKWGKADGGAGLIRLADAQTQTGGHK
jgi:hypothetical protein